MLKSTTFSHQICVRLFKSYHFNISDFHVNNKLASNVLIEFFLNKNIHFDEKNIVGKMNPKNTFYLPVY